LTPGPPTERGRRRKAIANAASPRRAVRHHKLWNATTAQPGAGAFERSASGGMKSSTSTSSIGRARPGRLRGAWRASSSLYHDGRVRAIGSLNSPSSRYGACGRDRGGPLSTRWSCTRFPPGTAAAPSSAGEGIATEAWLPLGQGEILATGSSPGSPPTRPHAAQVVLRWHIELGTCDPEVVTPGASRRTSRSSTSSSVPTRSTPSPPSARTAARDPTPSSSTRGEIPIGQAGRPRSTRSAATSSAVEASWRQGRCLLVDQGGGELLGPSACQLDAPLVGRVDAPIAPC